MFVFFIYMHVSISFHFLVFLGGWHLISIHFMFSYCHGIDTINFFLFLVSKK